MLVQLVSADKNRKYRNGNLNFMLFFHNADSPTEVTQSPMPKEDEINWILDEVSHYLSAGNKIEGNGFYKQSC